MAAIERRAGNELDAGASFRLTSCLRAQPGVALAPAMTLLGAGEFLNLSFKFAGVGEAKVEKGLGELLALALSSNRLSFKAVVSGFARRRSPKRRHSREIAVAVHGGHLGRRGGRGGRHAAVRVGARVGTEGRRAIFRRVIRRMPAQVHRAALDLAAAVGVVAPGLGHGRRRRRIVPPLRRHQVLAAVRRRCEEGGEGDVL